MAPVGSRLYLKSNVYVRCFWIITPFKHSLDSYMFDLRGNPIESGHPDTARMGFGRVESLYVISCRGMSTAIEEGISTQFAPEQHLFAKVKWYLQAEQESAYDPELYLPLVKSVPEPDGKWLPVLFPLLNCVPCEVSLVRHRFRKRRLVAFPWSRDMYFMCSAGFSAPPF